LGGRETASLILAVLQKGTSKRLSRYPGGENLLSHASAREKKGGEIIEKGKPSFPKEKTRRTGSERAPNPTS